jgi:hypothetical protein
MYMYVVPGLCRAVLIHARVCRPPILFTADKEHSKASEVARRRKAAGQVNGRKIEQKPASKFASATRAAEQGSEKRQLAAQHTRQAARSTALAKRHAPCQHPAEGPPDQDKLQMPTAAHVAGSAMKFVFGARQDAAQSGHAPASDKCGSCRHT